MHSFYYVKLLRRPATPAFIWTWSKASVCRIIKDKTVIPEGIVFFKVCLCVPAKKTGEWLSLKSNPGVLWKLACKRSKKQSRIQQISGNNIHTLHRISLWTTPQWTLNWTFSSLSLLKKPIYFFLSARNKGKAFWIILLLHFFFCFITLLYFL